MAVALQSGQGIVEAREIAGQIESALAQHLHRNREGLSVTSEEALDCLPRILVEYDERLVIDLVPFCKIPYAMYSVVLGRLLDEGMTVGVGVKASSIFRSTGDELHVVRVGGMTSCGVILKDFDLSGSEELVEWSLLERAIIEARSGYWVIGRDGEWRKEWI